MMISRTHLGPPHVCPYRQSGALCSGLPPHQTTSSCLRVERSLKKVNVSCRVLLLVATIIQDNMKIYPAEYGSYNALSRVIKNNIKI